MYYDRRVSSTAPNPIRRFLFDHSLLMLVVLIAVIVAASFWYLRNQQDQLLVALPVQGTELELQTLEELRSLYTSEVVEKMRKQGIEITHDFQGKERAIPLPATLTNELGQRLADSGTGIEARLYSDYPFPWRKEGGPRDAFEREALAALRRDPTRPFFRFEDYKGQHQLRYAVADRMRPDCISCHNTRPDSPKRDWKVGDVRGVLEVNRSITALAATAQAGQRRAFGLIGAMGMLGFAGVGMVFGKQRRDARALGEVAARLSAMDEASPLGTFVMDAQGRCTHLNQEGQRITGYAAEASRATAWSAGIHPEDRERVLARWQECVARSLIFAEECRFLRPDESVAWVSCKAAPMRSRAHLLGYVGSLEDITARKEAERMKNEFVSTVSHELRTPLTSIMGSLGLLAGGTSGELSGQAKTLVDIARKNGDRLVRLINDILDIEKIESGRMHFDLQPREVGPLLEQAMAANRAYAEQFGVSFVLDVQCPGLRARVDADRLMQVMTNLLGNAAKFSPAGGTVELQLSREGDRLRFAVTDRGSGIPESFRNKVFSKFSQADSSDSRRKGGTGLGLSISKAIVEAMGGEIGFITQEGVGTTFYFVLPEWVESAYRTAVAPTASGRLKVLVCEDDRDVAALLCMLLERAGYEPVPAYDAASARQLLADGGFAAMTLDIRLPDLDGRAFLKELRTQAATRDLAVVVVSGYLRKTLRAEEGDGLGVVDWIAKPIDEHRLIEAMRRGIRHDGGKARVLHVEDDADVRHVIASLCQEVAEFDCAATFTEAVERLESRAYDLVILDLELPDRSGWDLVPVIERLTPKPSVLVFSVTELSSAESGRVAAALVKSQVSNPELLHAVQALAGKGQHAQRMQARAETDSQVRGLSGTDGKGDDYDG